MTRARIIADYAGTGASTDLATQTELDAAETAMGFQSVPHIIPGVLYPAVAGKLLDGSTSHSGAYGTAQADGKSYYYTDIKGSKPIKDPRIGAHFGSQRHKFKSLQILEQETATHGMDVFSIDGRENMRMASKGAVKMTNDSHGLFIYGRGDVSEHWYLEVVGYFSALNIIAPTASSTDRGFIYKIDGGSDSAEQTTFETSVSTPLGSRYVDRGSLVSLVTGQTLGIHTLTMRSNATGDYGLLYGVELIAQEKFTDATCDYNNDPTITHDANTRIVAGLTVTGTGIPANATVASVTSSTEFELSAATTGGAVTNGTLTFGTNNIQIPSQNVVSYGKKFTVSDNPHYDPFNGFTSGTDISSYIDEATSLGMSNWKVSSTWYRPFNGGRVVKWVDSSGNIKTSVTMMPPNAQNIGTTASNAIDLSSSQTNDDTINFNTSAIDNSLSEVAKTFHWREFGNGAANGGTGATYADASMLNTADAIAYVMDDGLTSFSADEAQQDTDMLPSNNNKLWYLTFIGTGVTRRAKQHAQVTHHVAQNLPYGTHILKGYRGSSGTNTNYAIDGVVVGDIADGTYAEVHELTVHQPKKPPIPEEACILMDVMLMADFVAQTTASIEHISKGVRRISASRDFFYDGASAPNNVLHASTFPPDSMTIGSPSSSGHHMTVKLPVFGTRCSLNVEDVDQSDHGTNWAGTDTESSNTKVQSSGSQAYDILITPSATLGNNLINQTVKSSNHYFSGMTVATPIHTSSHYQTFETPFLKELVGGDRNMEQTNLVVTPDGKSWDEVTRDVSYISKDHKVTVQEDSDHAAGDIIFSEWRGYNQATHNFMNKDFAIAYDRMICLEEGTYHLQWNTHCYNSSAFGAYVLVNDVAVALQWVDDSSERSAATAAATVQLKRGDYVQCQANSANMEGSSSVYNNFNITKIL